MSGLSEHQQLVIADIRKDIELYLTRVIALPDFSTRLQDAIEELELEDKALLRALLECWTTLELVSSTDSERTSLKEITATIATLRELLHP